MLSREDVLEYGLTFSNVYVDTPFHDPNWVLLRYEKNKRAFAWTYEREGHIWVNVKVDPEWRDFWRNTYSSVIPAYHQNKEHWNSIILDGTIPDTDIKRMIAERYELICKRNIKKCKMASVQKRIGAFFMLGEIRAFFMSFWEEVQTWETGLRESQLKSEEIPQVLIKRYVE